MNALLLFITLLAGPVDKYWKAYNEAVENDFPKTADSILNVIVEQSQKTADYESLCRAWKYMGKDASIYDFMVSNEETLRRSHKVDKDPYPYIDDYEFFLSQVPQCADRLLEYCKEAGPEYIVNWAYRASDRASTLSEYETILDGCEGISRYIPLRHISRLKLSECKTEEEYLELDERFRKELSALSEISRKERGYAVTVGEYAEALKDARSWMRNTEGSYVWAEDLIKPYPSANEIKVYARNSDHVTAAVHDSRDKLLWSSQIDNHDKSFCAADTLSVTFPEFGDGRYTYSVTLPNGDNIFEMEYCIASLAVSSMSDSSGYYRYYVADARTGKPLDKVSYEIRGDADSTIRGTMSFDGFTSLPVTSVRGGIIRFLSDDGRESPWTTLYGKGRASYQDEGIRSGGDIFTDLGFYAPGDSVRFKFIGYGASGDSLYANSGMSVMVMLTDPESHVVDSVLCTTNEFGSASGLLKLPENGPVGWYRLTAGSHASKSLLVEYASLPSYKMDIDPIDEIYVYGDTVNIKGVVSMLNGVLPASASVRWTHRSVYGFISGTASLVSPGRFEIPVHVGRGYNHLDVRAELPDGQVVSSVYYFWGDSKGISLSVMIDADRNESGRYYVLSDSLRYDVTVTNTCGVVQDTSGVSVILKSVDGKDCGTSLKGLAPGKYCLSASLGEVSSQTWFYYVPENTVSADGFGGDYIYFPYDRDTYVLGTADTLWVSRNFAAAQMLLPGVWHIDADGAESVFFIRDAKSWQYRFSPKDVSVDEVSMKVTSFRDKAYPGSDECFVLEFDKSEDVEVLACIYDMRTDMIWQNDYWFNPRHIVRSVYVPYVSTIFGGPVYRPGYFARAGMAENSADMSAKSAFASIPVLRDDFRSLVAFYPQLRPDADGRLRVAYVLPDNLTSHKVQILAHDRSMRSVLWKDEISVTKSLMVTASAPEFLRTGDSLSVKVLVRNVSDEVQKGYFRFEILKDGDVVFEEESGYTEVGPSQESCFVVDMPSFDEGDVVIRYWFSADSGFSDGESRMLTVLPVRETVVRAVSGFSGGAPDMGLLGEYDEMAEYRLKVTVPLGSVLESIPYVKVGSNPSSIDLASAIQALRLVDKWVDTDSLCLAYSAELKGYQHPDGGFSWYEGGRPSVYVTMAVLDRFAAADEFGIKCSIEQAESVAAAVRWLDKIFVEQYDPEDGVGSVLCDYLYVRYKYSGRVSMQGDVKKFYDKCIKALRGSAGAGLGIESKLKTAAILEGGKGFDKVMRSLSEYAVVDRWGNRCFRPKEYGIFSSGVYVNALAAKLYSRIDSAMAQELVTHLLSVKDGMAWGNSFETAAAVAAVLSSPLAEVPGDLSAYEYDKDLDEASYNALFSGFPQQEDDGVLRVFSVYKESDEDMRGVESFSNGLSVNVAMLVRDSVTGKLKEAGDMLSQGDEVVFRYVIDNDEDRSFVMLEAMIPSGLEPEDKISGYKGYGCRSQILRDRVEYSMEFLAAGRYVIEEVYNVVNAGRYTAGYANVVSLYADSYVGLSDSMEIQAVESPTN